MIDPCESVERRLLPSYQRRARALAPLLGHEHLYELRDLIRRSALVAR
jgi:hypothetical protein